MQWKEVFLPTKFTFALFFKMRTHSQIFTVHNYYYLQSHRCDDIGGNERSLCCPTLWLLSSSVVIHAVIFTLLLSLISSAKSYHYAPLVTKLCCNQPVASNIHYTVAHCCCPYPPPSFIQVVGISTPSEGFT